MEFLLVGPTRQLRGAIHRVGGAPPPSDATKPSPLDAVDPDKAKAADWLWQELKRPVAEVQRP
jgi:hypothetical protein